MRANLEYFCHTIIAVAYLGFYFGWGGGEVFKIVLEKWGICMVLQNHAFSRGVWGYAPPGKFLKMVRFGEYFAKFL